MRSKVKLPYVAIIDRRDAHGRRVHAYYRRGGRMTPIAAPDGQRLLPGQPGFLDAYGTIDKEYRKAAEAPESPARSVAALAAAYLGSSSFATKAPATKVQYRSVTNAIVALIGPKLASAIEMPHVLVLRDKFGGTATPRKANKAVAMLSILMEHSRALGWRKDNPCLRPRKLATGPGYATWTAAEVETFLAHPGLGEPIKRVVALAYWTGARSGDLVTLPRSARADGAISFTPAKTARSTGAIVHMPEHPRLTAILDAAPPSGALTLLTRADGKPWGIDHLRHSITEAVAEAGLQKGLSMHGLRSGMVAALAEAGVHDAGIEALVPHADPAMTRRYRRNADQKHLANAAMKQLAGAVPSERVQRYRRAAGQKRLAKPTEV